MFNIKPNSKKSYYFDDRFSESKFVRPLLARRNRIIIISLVILILSSVLWFTKSSIDHARELNELKTLVSAFINVSRYNQISESEINLVAEEIYNAGKKYRH